MPTGKILNIITSKVQQPLKQAASSAVIGTNKIVENAGEQLILSLDGLASKNIGYGFQSSQNTAMQAIQKKIEEIKRLASSVAEDYFTLSDGTKKAFRIFEGTQMGSNKGFWVLSNETGELYYAKFSRNNTLSQSESEVLTSKIYKLLGLNVPEMQLIKNSNGEMGVLSKFIPDLVPVRHPEQKINEGFVADVFLANWDAVISDNAQKNANELYRIDFGGALDYRAMGKHKGFSIVPDEITTLLNPEINHESANLYSTLTRSELIASLKKLASLDEDDLYELIMKYCSSSIEAQQEGEEIFAKLLKRKEFLSYVLECVGNTPQKANQTLFEYLEEIKSKVLSTPLIEFKTYLRNNPNANSACRTSLMDKIKSILNSRKSYKQSLREAMLKQRDGLDENSIEAFRDIKSNDSKINLFIRHPVNNQPFDYSDSDLQRLDIALSKCRIPKNAILYRATGAYEFSFDDYIPTKEFLDKFYKKGEYFTIVTYPDTSVEKKCSERFTNKSKDIIYKINAPRGTTGAYIEGIPEAWDKINEDEVLLARNLIYRFKNMKPYFTHQEIELDIVDAKKLPKKAIVHNYTDEINEIKQRGLFGQYFPSGEIDYWKKLYSN